MSRFIKRVKTGSTRIGSEDVPKYAFYNVQSSYKGRGMRQRVLGPASSEDILIHGSDEDLIQTFWKIEAERIKTIAKTDDKRAFELLQDDLGFLVLCALQALTYACTADPSYLQKFGEETISLMKRDLEPLSIENVNNPMPSCIDGKGRITVPASILRDLGWKPGTTIGFEREGKKLKITKRELPMDSAWHKRR